MLKLINEYEQQKGIKLRIKELALFDSKQIIDENNYWKDFYKSFTDFLFNEKHCFDNYTGMVIRTIKAFFRYVSDELQINIGNYYDRFYVLKEEIPIITLLPEQVYFLINDKVFESKLSTALKRSKNLFVFGCLLALRYSDLFNIRVTDIEEACGNKYLSIKTQKTNTQIRLKLSGYTLCMAERLIKKAGKRTMLIPRLSKNQFNKNIKKIAEKAGWTNVMPKTRNRRGKRKILYRHGSTQQYRFCDLLSSHCMRRTAITMMLMFGVPEHVVKMISGHSNNSQSFYRYVNLVQSYLDVYMEKVGERFTVSSEQGINNKDNENE